MAVMKRRRSLFAYRLLRILFVSRTFRTTRGYIFFLAPFVGQKTRGQEGKNYFTCCATSEKRENENEKSKENKNGRENSENSGMLDSWRRHVERRVLSFRRPFLFLAVLSHVCVPFMPFPAG